MHSLLLVSLPVACAAGLLFSGYRRRAKHQHDLQMIRNRILFGISDAACPASRIVNGRR